MLSFHGRFCVLVSSLLVTAVIACNPVSRDTRAAEASAAPSERPDPAKGEGRDVLWHDVVPLYGGGAYATTLGQGAWFLAGDSAVRVRVLGDSADSAAFADATVLAEVTPTIDGGAYLTALAFGLWYLHADTARPVRQVVTASVEEAVVSEVVRQQAFLRATAGDSISSADASW